jgi:hypothetical protein
VCFSGILPEAEAEGQARSPSNAQPGWPSYFFNSLPEVLVAFPNLEIVKIWETDDARGVADQVWINFIVRKLQV